MKIKLWTLCIAIILLIAHVLGMKYDIYVRWDPYDIIMHILGGFSVGFFVCLLAQHFRPTRENIFKICISAVLLAGVSWEIFEMIFDLSGHPIGSRPYYIDTFKDVFNDLVGGLLIAYIFRKKLNK